MNLTTPPLKPQNMNDRHRYQDLCRLFDQCFAQSENTRLIKGQGEPVYLPAGNKQDHHQIVFAHGYFASALHEIAHWCIAGEQRRLLEDYGYWYCPDGRSSQQQGEFEQVEIKPQAIEWAFCVAAKKRFCVSTDNLHGAQPDTLTFQAKVQQQALHYLQQGFPIRAQQFIRVLQCFYLTAGLCPKDFPGPDLILSRETHGKI
ncbi:MAG: elongation factor P hydroxylase [Paraglaciecola sp.]|jgi:elongation factor P hydroxylase